MSHINFLLCPSAIQFTDHLQPTPQKMPQAPHRGKMLVKGHHLKVIGGKKSGKPDKIQQDRTLKKERTKVTVNTFSCYFIIKK